MPTRAILAFAVARMAVRGVAAYATVTIMETLRTGILRIRCRMVVMVRGFAAIC